MWLDIKQKKQENQYFIPYHWAFKQKSKEAREYFGYVNIVLDLLGKKISNQKILDVGCGDGRISFEVFQKGAEVWGVDYSERAISFAKILSPNVNFEICDIKKMPFKPNFFDKIILIEVLEHIHPMEIPFVLRELNRVLKRGGQLVITVPTILTPVQTKHYQHFSKKKIEKDLESFFKIKKIIGQNKNSFLCKNLYRLIENRFWRIKPLEKFFNFYIYPKFFNRCDCRSSKRFVILCEK